MAMKPQGVLITGASGMVGSALIQQLLKAQIPVHAISSRQISGVKCFPRPTSSTPLHPDCLLGMDTIVHLAGASIAEGRWTKKRKKEIVTSRTEVIGHLSALLRKQAHHNIKTLISTSATGIYGDTGDKVIDEDSPPGQGFLAETCQLWEAAAQQLGQEANLRTVIFRLGVILANEGGLIRTLRPFLYSPLSFLPGGGQQYVPWVALTDVVSAYEWAMYHDIKGVYNLCAPQVLRWKDLMRKLSHVPLQVPLKIPVGLLKVGMGEKAQMLVESQKIPTSLLQEMGFAFKIYPLERDRL
jgi:uncharacterized protein (TIGR01777 family)